jgi:hypothetical protein
MPCNVLIVIIGDEKCRGVKSFIIFDVFLRIIVNPGIKGLIKWGENNFQIRAKAKIWIIEIRNELRVIRDLGFDDFHVIAS